ncbi:hypothetical protein LK08_04570 [Streptomyces sp. MUSC 125]|nr:hypothetical protein LK08_04570 [Streptomyces sp. MUSC 125]
MQVDDDSAMKGSWLVHLHVQQGVGGADGERLSKTHELIDLPQLKGSTSVKFGLREENIITSIIQIITPTVILDSAVIFSSTEDISWSSFSRASRSQGASTFLFSSYKIRDVVRGGNWEQEHRTIIYGQP